MKTYPVKYSKCNHPPTDVKPGPRIILRYGSCPSEVCERCGAYRLILHGVRAWQPGPPNITDPDEELA